MADFIKSIFLFILYSVIGYCVILTMFGLIVPDKYLPNLKNKLGGTGFTFSRLTEAKEAKDLDVLFLGSSHAYRGFDTRIFEEAGYKVFNIGSSTQTPLQTKILLQRYLEKFKPKQIVYEVYPLIFCSDGVESALDIVSNDKNDLLSLDMAKKLDHALIYNSLIYASIRDLTGLNKNYKEKSFEVLSRYVSGGFVERELRYFRTVEYPKDSWKFHDIQFEYFEEIVSMLTDQDIEVIYVYAPITKTKYQSFDNNKEFDLRMQKYGSYYNLNETIDLDDSLHFYDSNHLNSLGVQIFNETVIDLLSRNKK